MSLLAKLAGGWRQPPPLMPLSGRCLQQHLQKYARFGPEARGQPERVLLGAILRIEIERLCVWQQLQCGEEEAPRGQFTVSFQVEDIHRTCIFGPKTGQVQRCYSSWLPPACMLSNACLQGAAATFRMRKYSAKARTYREQYDVLAVAYESD